MGSNDREMGRLNVGFVNCRGWWSREVDLKLVMGLKRFDVLRLAEMFLQKGEEVSVTGFVWYGRNREGGGRQASGAVRVLVNRSLESRVCSAREGLAWVELRGEGRRKLMIGVVYVNPESLRVEEMESLSEVMQVDVMKYEEKVLMLWWRILMEELFWEQKITQIVMGGGCWIL